MIYEKMLSLYLMQLGRFETDVIKATNNVMRTDCSSQALLELIRAKTLEEWYRVNFREVLEYIKALEKLD